MCSNLPSTGTPVRTTGGSRPHLRRAPRVNQLSLTNGSHGQSPPNSRAIKGHRFCQEQQIKAQIFRWWASDGRHKGRIFLRWASGFQTMIAGDLPEGLPLDDVIYPARRVEPPGVLVLGLLWNAGVPQAFQAQHTRQTAQTESTPRTSASGPNFGALSGTSEPDYSQSSAAKSCQFRKMTRRRHRKKIEGRGGGGFGLPDDGLEDILQGSCSPR